MLCPLCRTRKARRACPALGKDICAVCCGTKRLTEIACPPTCGYLASAREHPPAVVRRQQERDVTVLLPTIQHLTERQHQLFFLLHSAIARHKPEGFARLVDDDVAEAAGAFAATLETASRGVIYEHGAQSLVAQRLLAEMKALVAQLREQGAKVFDSEAAIVMRAIEQGARETRKTSPEGEVAYITLMSRLLRQGGPAGPDGEPAAAPPERASSLILP